MARCLPRVDLRVSPTSATTLRSRIIMIVDREPQVITTKHTSAASHLYEVHLRTNDGEGAAEGVASMRNAIISALSKYTRISPLL